MRHGGMSTRAQALSKYSREGCAVLLALMGAIGLFIASALVRAALAPAYRSTDFEVHRNWLAITHSLPLSKWYFEDTSQWTLDYPPLFAYFEWLLSQVAVNVDAKMVQVENLEYVSTETILFQRASVICGDIFLALGVYRVSSLLSNSRWMASLTVVMLNPALLLVDHVHFQYNGMLLGLLLLSVAEIGHGRVYVGAWIFSMLVNAKHIFLYVAPVYFVYLLRSHCEFAVISGKLSLRFGRLCLLAMVVLSTFGVLWAPIIVTGQGVQAVQRLFPFGRGLTHAYWAPNVWALYNTLDRVLLKAGFGSQLAESHSSTSGLAEVYEAAVLWTVSPKATLLLVVLTYVPLLVLIWLRTSPQRRAKQGARHAKTMELLLFVALGNAVPFAVGWHVHEKAILQATIPLLVAAASSQSQHLIHAVSALSLIATFSVLPLLPQTPVDIALKWSLLLSGHTIEATCLSRVTTEVIGKKPSCWSMFHIGLVPGALVVLGIAALGIFNDFGGKQILLGSRMDFLPLMLISDFSSCLCLLSFGHLFWIAVNFDDKVDVATGKQA